MDAVPIVCGLLLLHSDANVKVCADPIGIKQLEQTDVNGRDTLDMALAAIARDLARLLPGSRSGARLHSMPVWMPL